MRNTDVSPLLKARARAMRHGPTEAEAALWKILRGPRLSALKFRRQAPIPPYIVDFLCFEHRLIVEADGSQHAENPRDDRRDAFLLSQEFTIVRFWTHEILHARAAVENTILARCGLPW
ncbi:very-short-patch-repair endonuclease [Rhodoblastus acidophilus]|uniref:endonuclease domain-containing protein n=1 Tax=Rhodoblastus acidophilus TaxID=1074 RepID=UPI0022244668|nr:DUF559 domain-containing protein [Rhodoblastus acidophilus]MCW2285555.1 very-short-patch-repair endonuclease [Rhodoblastus acidophilus]MCW2334529.1 very-short-patch-repair endonuclease [Rhodoblastus acidophilus]